MRQVFPVRSAGYEFVGTHHRPELRAPVTQPAFLFFNAGHLPRDGHAMIGARSADRLARLGFHVFRVDLPGLGDAPGEVPEHTDDLFRMIHEGAFVDPAREALRALRRLHGIDRFVVGGLCGAAGTAIHLATREPETVAGILAVELELFLPGFVDLPLPAREALLSRAAWLRLLTGHGRRSGWLPFSPEPLLPLIGPALLPDHTDRPLVEAFVSLVRRRMPMLVIMAARKRREIFYDQVCKALLGRSPRPWLTNVSLPGTNHILTTGDAQQAALAAVEAWAHSFARARPGEPARATPQPQNNPA